MADINRCMFTGRLTRDSELRDYEGGKLLRFSLAVNGSKHEDGKWVDVPNYFDFTMFGARAESLASYLKKGVKVAVDAKARFSSWEKDDERHTKVDFQVQDLAFCDGPKPKAADSAAATPEGREYPAEPVF